MKQFKSLSVGMKIFVAFFVLQLIVVTVLTILNIVTIPNWDTDIFGGIIFAIILSSCIGFVEWFFIEMLKTDILKD